MVMKEAVKPIKQAVMAMQARRGYPEHGAGHVTTDGSMESPVTECRLAKGGKLIMDGGYETKQLDHTKPRQRSWIRGQQRPRAKCPD